MARWLTLAGFTGLIASACEWTAGPTSLGYVMGFVLIATGATLEKPGVLKSAPFRQVSGAIAALCLLSLMSMIYRHGAGEDILVLPSLMAAIVGSVTGWFTLARGS